MFYLSFFRKTALFGLISFLVSLCTSLVSLKAFFEYCLYPNSRIEMFCAFMFWSVPGYVFLSLIHIFVCKIILKGSRNAGEIFFGALWADIISPIRSIITFIVVITCKHIIDDDSEEHEFQDFVQIVFGFIWTIVLGIYIFSGFWAITHFWAIFKYWNPPKTIRTLWMQIWLML